MSTIKGISNSDRFDTKALTWVEVINCTHTLWNEDFIPRILSVEQWFVIHHEGNPLNGFTGCMQDELEKIGQIH